MTHPDRGHTPLPWAYYNEHDEFAAGWLRNLIKAGLIADGEVDTRSIVDVRPDDVRGFNQCHFFAGIGGWSYALRKAGWNDSRPAWTGSCPCQPFSLAGAQRGFADERHLWPVWRELIRECRPAVVFGEQVASATAWLRLVRGDLEAMGYAVGAMPIQAASAGADHLRDRYWFVAHDDWQRQQAIWNDRSSGVEGERPPGSGHRKAFEGAGCSFLADAACEQVGSAGQPRECGDVEHASRFTEREPHDQGDTIADGREARPILGGSGDTLEWVIGADGKARRVKSGIRLLAHGVPNRVGLLRGFGNAIDPRPAAAFIEAYMIASEAAE